MYPHRIRLRGPWECEPHTAGRVRCRRRFGYPGRIDDYERVWLTFTGMSGNAEVWLNGTALGSHQGAFEFEVTSQLKPRNKLIVEVEGTDDGRPWGDVALEVRCTAYLRDVRVWVEQGKVHAEGHVVGTAERPLELYMIQDRSTTAYATTEATPGGTPFQLTGEGASQGAPQAVRVELVNVAIVWYLFETTLQSEAILPSSRPFP
jgi:hypothetical protein